MGKPGRRWTCRTGLGPGAPCGPCLNRRASVQALRSEPSSENSALSFASDVEDEALAQSVFVRNVLVLLEEMGGKETTWISSSSNCRKKKCATRLRGLISSPGLEATEHFRKGKTYGEKDVGELHLLRLLVERAGLIRSAGLWFRADAARPRHAGARKAGHASGVAVSPCLLGHGPFSLRARASPRIAGGGGRRARSASSSGGCPPWQRIGRTRPR